MWHAMKSTALVPRGAMSHLACGAWAREPLERFHSNGKTGCYGGKLNETVHITGYSSFLVFTGIIVISFVLFVLSQEYHAP